MTRALDAFCGQGGTTQGLLDAGFDEVVGVDEVDHSRRYPGTFVQGDALDYITEHGADFDVIIAGPPCQGYSKSTAGNPTARAKYWRGIPATRTALQATGRPWVIENVHQAHAEMREPILLCGRMFGLETIDEDGTLLVLDRHRLFESNVPLTAPRHPAHTDTGPGWVAGVYGGSRRAKRLEGETLAQVAPRDRHAARHIRKGGYVPRSLPVRQALMGGVSWMTVKGLEESIPPAYSRFLGRQLLAHVAPPF